MNFEKLKDFLDNFVPTLGVPGSDTVVYKDHKEVFRYRSGVENLELSTRVRSDATYNLYSCTKVATCTAAMQLIESAKILANDPLYEYFPEYKNIKVIDKGEVRESTKPILVKHLFGMMSGLDYNLSRPAIKKVFEKTEGRCPTLDVIRALPEDPFMFEAGARYQYSLSHDVLGGLVELVSGKKLGDYMRENIFEPLGMKDTGFDLADKALSHMATQYNYDNVNKKAIEIPKSQNQYRLGTEYQSGGAGLISTADDYILLADALANYGMGKSGERILSPRTVDLMRSTILTSEQNRNYATDYHVGYNYCYGVRVMTNPAEAGSIIPKGTFGWDGAKMSFVFASPEERVGLFHATHVGGCHDLLIPRIMNLIYLGLEED